MFEPISPGFLAVDVPAIVIAGNSKSGFGSAFGAPGQKAQGHLSPRAYMTICQSLLGLSGAKLIFFGLTHT